jgi:predicted naringenin-chalcone synthase
MIIATHFADGAAAALISRRQIAPSPTLCLRSFCSLKLHADPGLLTWRLGDGGGFVMGLGRRLPGILADGVERLVAKMPVDDPEERSGWVIHPGGRAIVEAIGEQLGLTSHDLAPSLGTLADFGNMSSPTVLFALERYDQVPTQGRLIAFGPGPSIEGMCWSKPQSVSPPS